ncbi:LysR family transcriptional regulator [Neorhizobium petrolearium]|uniref:LysR substrate-binding domain-containing protein n=1 Tax=Neorhizobium petrolearium TaxID=515361 RepID=UPI001AE55E4B|nr:LysR family transcriptional regulator [Neorhizobium petrolearium]
MTPSSLYLDRLRLRHLRLLEMVDRSGSLREVADQLNLTQPAISQMVKDLEVAFGVPLVARSARGASLTAAGRHALQRARAGLATFEHLASELRTVPPALVRIGTNPTLSYDLLPRAMHELRLIESDTRIQIVAGVVSAMMQGLLDGSFDCYVGRIEWDLVPAGTLPLLRATPLTGTDLTLACSRKHPLAGRRDIKARELLDWPWALTTPETSNRTSFDSAFRNLGLPPPEPKIEMIGDPSAFISMATQIDVLICIPRIAFRTVRGAVDILPLDVKELELSPILTHFLTLKETEELPEICLLRAAMRRAVGNNGEL